MAKYDGTFSCGHEGRVDVVGPTKNRQWIVDRKFEGMCPECYAIHLETERTKINKIAAEKAAKMELPELQGSEKQVAWSNTLRQKLIDNTEKEIISMKERNVKNLDAKLEVVNDILQYILVNKADAIWFINNRLDLGNLETLFTSVKKEMKEVKETEENSSEIDVKMENTVKPESATTEIPVEILVQNDKITVKFEKNDKFREIVKSLGYKWDGAWVKNINELTGSVEDRAAELGNKLLNAGFPITIMNEDIRNNAISGTYEVECDRWIVLRNKGDHAGKLAIRWWEHNDKLYSTSRNLPSSRWDNPYVVVKIEYYKEVEEFAKLYGFKFNESSLNAIEEYKKLIAKVEVVNPVETIEEEPKDGLKEILNSGTEILDDLRED